MQHTRIDLQRHWPFGRGTCPRRVAHLRVGPSFFFSTASELMHTSQTQGRKRASSVPTTFADYSPPWRAPHGVRASGSLGYCRTCMSYIAHYSESLPYSSKIQRGVSSARSDDTKSLKGAVLDWIFPRDGDMRNVLPIDPPPQPLSRNVKTNRGFHHPLTGALLCPAGLDYNDAERVS